MTANDRFFSKPKAAAVLKHGVLARYPVVFAQMTGSRSLGGRVVYLDGYAGPGHYADGAPGSPVIALTNAGKSEGMQRVVECWFVEADPDHARNLSQWVDDNAAPGVSARVLQGDVEQHLPQVLAAAADAPLLAFLDPFGTALAYDVFTQQLLSRPGHRPTEAIVNINLEAIARLGGLLGSGADARQHTPSDSVALQHADRFFGDTTWRERFAAARGQAGGAAPGAAAAAARAVIDEYRSRIRRDTGFDSFPVPVRRRPWHEPLFFLTLFFRHEVAPWKFNEAVSGANTEWRSAQRDIDLEEELEREDRTGQGSIFGATAAEQDSMAEDIEARLEQGWVDVIRVNLGRLLERDGVVSLRAQLAEVFGATLGLARDKHVTRAWDQLADEGLAAMPRSLS